MVDSNAEDRAVVAKLAEQMSLSCKEYKSGQDFLAEYEQSWPGCLVVEVRIPDVGGLQIQHALARDGAPLPVVFLTGYADAPTAVRAMRAGAVQFLEKPSNDHTLWDAIQEAIALDAQLRREHAEHQEREEVLGRLTEKEYQVLELVLDGKSSQRIAKELDVCVRTVEIRRSSMMKKLEVRSVPELLKFAATVIRGNLGNEEYLQSPWHDGSPLLRPHREPVAGIARRGNGNGNGR
ncbi:MAG: response regulator transcription factor [Candidatus Nealsonbacteria bacterium]|nr:response regulator transcription factor [Candidatus Nealsonbacteria bacterium]